MNLLLTLLLYLIVLSVVWWLCVYVIQNLPLPDPIPRIAKVVVTVVMVLLLLGLLLSLVGAVPAFPGFFRPVAIR